MFKNLLLIAFLLDFSNQALAQKSGTEEAFDIAIEKVMDDESIPGLSVSIIKNGRVVYSKALGIRTEGEPLEISDKFHVASISKLFTATAIMKLENEGRLSLDDRLGRYLPEFEGTGITLRHLLTHRSGLRDQIRPNGATRQEEVNNYVSRVAKDGASNSPDEKWRYADVNFNLLGEVITKVSGKPYAVYLKENVLDPLGMAGSSFVLADIPKGKRADPFKKSFFWLSSPDHPWDLAFAPSSGLQSNATDLAQFALMVIGRGELNGKRLLPEETFKRMWEPLTETDWGRTMMGLAWQLPFNEDGRLVIRHAGSDDGFQSLLTIYLDEGDAIILVGNLDDWPRFELHAELIKILRDETLEKP